MDHVGVLAYGSLITSPGWELEDAEDRRVEGVLTPFGVEFARKSRVRGGAPTLVPVKAGGSRVTGTVLVMRPGVGLSETRNITYRREINQVGNLERVYQHNESPGENDVQLPMLSRLAGIEQVIYTVLAATIPETIRTGEYLAQLAIKSVSLADEGRDGITYLRDAISAGIRTSLTEEYRDEVLRLTGAGTLDEAIVSVRGT